MHTALHSDRHPATVMRNMTLVAQDDCPAPSCRLYPRRQLVASLIFQAIGMMHLERTIGVAACLALLGTQARDQIVRALRKASLP
jgi:hypothetical protein